MLKSCKRIAQDFCNMHNLWKPIKPKTLLEFEKFEKYSAFCIR